MRLLGHRKTEGDMAMKIAASVTNCNNCPSRHYGSGGVYECGGMNSAPLPANAGIPEWCPLPDHPGPIAARAMHAVANVRAVLDIARQEATTADERRLRELIQIAADQVARI
jgi:hypothetical protein